MEILDLMWPQPQEIVHKGEFPLPETFSLHGELLDYLQKELSEFVKFSKGGFLIKTEFDDNFENESYKLKIDQDRAKVSAKGATGLCYGIQTLLQIIAYCKNKKVLPELDIFDYPDYRKRGFMVDMGRSVFTLPMLKRIVLILERLKMNQLHLHLYDDELCGIKFDGFPMGHDNPYALTLDEFEDLVYFAMEHHIEIVPELEAWGHVNSIVHFFPELRGNSGMFSGSSFLICKKVFALMEILVGQVVARMPKKATIHLGLDEALWKLSDEMPKDFLPKDLVMEYYNMLQKIGKKMSKQLTMRIWNDHNGRPVPDEIKDKVILEPWMYWNKMTNLIDEHIIKFSNTQTPWMAAGGQSMGQYRGAYHATRYWCRHAVDAGKIQGVNITFWGRNELENHFITLFAGAGFCWNSNPSEFYSDVEDYEVIERVLYKVLLRWQDNFKDGNPDAIKAERPADIFGGWYTSGAMRSQALTPSVVTANSRDGHNYIKESLKSTI